MARILRGDIVWADLNPTQGHEQGGCRPVVVLSHDVFNDRSGTIIGMAITSHPQRFRGVPRSGIGMLVFPFGVLTLLRLQLSSLPSPKGFTSTNLGFNAF